MRIVFCGAGEFGLATLVRLCEAHDVVLVLTQPDRPAGRHRQLTPTPIAEEAEHRGLDVRKVDNANAPEVLDAVGAAEPDAMVIVAFGQYLKQSLVSIPRLGAMNLHASLLPKYRGAGPIHAALLNGETETGNTVMRIAKTMDAGDILGQQALPIDPLETAGELHDRLSRLGPDLVLNVLRGLEAGTVPEVQQDDSQATLAPKISRADAWVDFGAPARQVRCRVHGLTPWPGVSVQLDTGKGEPLEVKLRRVMDAPDAKAVGEPGTLVTESGLVVCGEGAVQLLEVQPPGKRAMQWEEFQRGHAVPAGAQLKGRPAPSE